MLNVFFKKSITAYKCINFVAVKKMLHKRFYIEEKKHNNSNCFY